MIKAECSHTKDKKKPTEDVYFLRFDIIVKLPVVYIYTGKQCRNFGQGHGCKNQKYLLKQGPQKPTMGTCPDIKKSNLKDRYTRKFSPSVQE